MPTEMLKHSKWAAIAGLSIYMINPVESSFGYRIPDNSTFCATQDDPPCDKTCPFFASRNQPNSQVRKRREVAGIQDVDFDDFDFNFDDEESESEAAAARQPKVPKYQDADYKDFDLYPGWRRDRVPDYDDTVGSFDRKYAANAWKFPGYENNGCMFPDFEDEGGPLQEEDPTPPADWVPATHDCRGNPLPVDLEFWKANPVAFNGGYHNDTLYSHFYRNKMYIKQNVAYHFPKFNNMAELMEGHNYCEGLGLEATYLWCPGNREEMEYVWMYHPDQPFDISNTDAEDTPDCGSRDSFGLFTGLRREFQEETDSGYICGRNNTYQWYEHPGWMKFHTSQPDYVFDPWGIYWEPHVHIRVPNAQMADECLVLDPGYNVYYAGHGRQPHGSIVCEMNCDMLDVDPVLPEDTTCPHECEQDCYKGQCICNKCSEKARGDGSCMHIKSYDVEFTWDDEMAFDQIMYSRGDVHTNPCWRDTDPNHRKITENNLFKLKRHGCHCSQLHGAGHDSAPDKSWAQYAGLGAHNSVDALDAACAKYIENKKCIFLPGGPCEGYDPSTTTYTINFNDDYKEEYAQCVDSQNTNACSKAMCEIELFHITRVYDEWMADWAARAEAKGWDEDQWAPNKINEANAESVCPHCGLCLPPAGCMGSYPDYRMHHGVMDDL